MQVRVDGKIYVANYSSFVVYDETTNYRMYVSGYSGNVTDSFTFQSGMMFTTKDRDNDPWSGDNCAVYEGGGFWYNGCAWACVATKIGVSNDFSWLIQLSASNYWLRLSQSQMWIWC
jgi:Fibrinogen beta and gamma chains, C-terminal globular domain